MKAMVRFNITNSYSKPAYAQLDRQFEQGAFDVRFYKGEMERIRCFDGSGDR